MSRYEIHAKNPALVVVVGWDNPMGTYFAQVVREAKKIDQENQILLWLGGIEREYLDAVDMIPKLAPYATLTQDMLTTLHNDRVAMLDRGPTPLQRFGRSL